ncbi:uncharacterized protein N7487_009220 [Penicillium crustosum]|uniref:uncharacterized protein n=1 Tax=Penicillium crustosum TaxID=36656 RepID=UPI002384E882|nr:uncharacterized protein N7487_009220 [Penicillium crustosum]KAJ5394917.1 hypothetical protein N7487_009220 [Penicillium crustosum]
MSTAAVVTGYNLAFWFDDSGGGAQQPPRQGCGPPYIFLLSKQQLTGSVIALCRTAAVIIAVVVFPLAILLLYLMLTFCWYTSLFLYRDLIYLLNQTRPHTLLSALSRINPLLEQGALLWQFAAGPSMVPGLFNVTFVVLTDVLGFLAMPKANAIRFSDVIKVCVSLGTGKVTRNEMENTLPTHGAGMMPGWKEARFIHRAFCSLWNVYVVLSIAWFIASIECTIHWNYIQGVNDIQTTGQLIPFVIGCKYRDWADTRLELGDGIDRPVIFKIVKMNKGDDSEEESTKDKPIGNDQFERPIATMHMRRQSV